MKNSDVATAFLRKEKRVVNTLHLLSTRDKLFSYNTCIAQYHDNQLIGNATKYSTTSSRHIHYIKKYVDV